MTDPSEPSGRPGIFAQLQRRNVLRAGAIYIAAVWALSQGIAQLAPVFHAPEWITRWFVIAGVIGFPFWIAFSWFFELTPSGFKRESESQIPDSVRRHTGRTLDFWIIGILGVAVVLLVTNQFVLRNDATSASAAARLKAAVAALAKVPEKSVAVMPLTNDSGDPKQQYFSDGLSEELISDLTQINGLKVIGKYSSFKFRNSSEAPAVIGSALGVAHLIYGSVRQQGKQIRVTVNMIRARDGSSVWSHTYDEQLKDVFAIQSKIGHAVAAALKIKLIGHAIVSTDKPPSGNVQAYQLMLQGHALVRRSTLEGYTDGIALLRQALALDPRYAYAWGVLSTALVNQGRSLSGTARRHAFAQARTAANTQRRLAPDAAATHMSRGYLLANIDNDPVGAMTEFRRALELAPNDGTTMTFLAFGLANVGKPRQAAALFRKAINTDPLQASWYAPLVSMLMADGQLDAATQAADKALTLQPNFPGMQANLALIDILRNDAAAAAHAAAQETDATYGPWARAMAAQINPDRRKADTALRNYIAKYGSTQPYLVADLYAVRKQPDVMFKWLQRAWEGHDPSFPSMLYDPFALAYRHDPRFVSLCKQAGLPVPGQAQPATARSSGL